MANASFSPKDYRVFVQAEATNGTDAGIGGTLLQLDVDSIGFPSLNLNQVADVRTGVGSIAQEVDFFQDHKAVVTEYSISGTLHNDNGHKLLLQNIMGSTAGTIATTSTYAPASGTYGTTTVSNATFTTYIVAKDNTDGLHVIMTGCLCTNFAITADIGTEGGMYKFNATIQTGKAPAFNDATAIGSVGANVYSGSQITMAGLTAGAIKVRSVNPILQSFGVTIDSPAVFSGVDSSGYKAFARASETAITATTTVKLDDLTRGLVHEFQQQASGTADDADSLVLTQGTDTNFSITMPRSILTNVAYNEGDIMMLDVEMKGVGSGTDNVLTVKVA